MAGPKPKLLLVDDEASILVTLSAILEMHGFEVKACASVREALAAMQSEHYDVLLSDLNIGEPGDGFTVVSAMRRTQPDAVTIIITGYPAFETALQAIRSQVDDYIVKPTKADDLVRLIQQRLERQDRHNPPPLRKVSFVLEDMKETIVHRFVTALRNNAHFPVKQLSPDDISDHLPEVIGELILILRNGIAKQHDGESTATAHGKTRLRQGFTMPQMVQEIGILRGLMFEVLQENLLGVDVSSVIPDMTRIDQVLDQCLTESLQAYMSAELALKPA